MVRSRFDALGTYVELVLADRPAALGTAVRLLRAELAALDIACSRFRPDSELVRANAAAGRPVTVSPLLAEAIAVALQAAEQTGGDVDPTLADALVAAGYDGDFAGLPTDGAAVVPRPPRLGAWQEVELDPVAGTLRVPTGVGLDLGATAKAFAADRAAELVAAETGAGVLVNLGGDIAVAGPERPGGWPVRVTDRPVHADDGGSGQIVHIHGGGLATSSTAVRQWRRGGVVQHHILDPRTGRPVEPVWRTVTVTAATCTAANTASTAAVVRGRAALDWLAGLGLPSRLLGSDGQVHRVGGWPADEVQKPPAGVGGGSGSAGAAGAASRGGVDGAPGRGGAVAGVGVGVGQGGPVGGGAAQAPAGRVSGGGVGEVDASRVAVRAGAVGGSAERERVVAAGSTRPARSRRADDRADGGWVPVGAEDGVR